MWMQIFELIMSDQFGRLIEIVQRAKGDRSQAEFAREIGVSPATVQKWLAGNGYPSSENMEKIARVAGLSLDALHAYLKGEARQQNAERSPEEIFLMSKNLSKEQRKHLLKLMIDDLD